MQWLGRGGWEKKNKKTRVKVVVARKVVHCGWRWCRWRWSKRGGKGGWQRRRKENQGRDDFFANFAPLFLLPQAMKSTSIYRGWTRDILSLMVPNLGPWLDPEGSPSLVQSGYYKLSDFDSWRLVGLATLGQRHNCCGKEEWKDKGEGLAERQSGHQRSCCCREGCALWSEVVLLEVEQKRGKGRLAEEKKRKLGKRWFFCQLRTLISPPSSHEIHPY